VDHTRTASYKLTSTVMLHMTTSSPTLGSMNLSGNLTRQVYPPFKSGLICIG
jgi:capping protein (actin filament) muscle Z-line, beta